jgi:hypothetical protein
VQLAAHDRQRPFFQPCIVARAAHQLEGIPQRRQGVAELVRQRGQEFVLSPGGVPQHLFRVPPLGHVHADADAPVDQTFRVVQRLDVVLHVDDAPVRPHDLDVVGHAHPVRDGVLHRQVGRRDRLAAPLDPISRLLAGGRSQRDVDVVREAQQA